MSRTVAIMQPYFFPYVGYFKLIAEADVFVVYDDVQYIKGGWSNRNRIRVNGEPRMLTFPVRHGPYQATYAERSYDFAFKRDILNQIRETYRKASQFGAAMPLIEEIMEYPEARVAAFNRNLLERICEYLGIDTPFMFASEIPKDNSIPCEPRIISMVKAIGGTSYLNAPGGRALYRPEAFAAEGLELAFVDGVPPALSIIDTLMVHPVHRVRKMMGYAFFAFEKASRRISALA
jgi:hypothetical protein